MSKLQGVDKSGRVWTGVPDGNRIDWRSDDGLSGTEIVEKTADGRMRGVAATGDCKPCDYDGKNWNGRGACPNGSYVESDD